MKKLLAISGITFVTAWITGLMAATNGPKPTATGTALKAYYSTHQHAAMLQTLCVDALAALALIGITIGIARMVSDPIRRRIQIAGFTAAAISLSQAGIGEALAVQGAGSGNPSFVRALFVTLNNADTIRSPCSAVLVILVSTAARDAMTLPRWLTTLGIAFAPVLALSGLAFPLNSDALYGALYITLPAAALDPHDQHQAEPTRRAGLTSRFRGHPETAGLRRICPEPCVAVGLPRGNDTPRRQAGGNARVRHPDSRYRLRSEPRGHSVQAV